MQIKPSFKARYTTKQFVYLAALSVLLAVLFLPQSLTGINIFDEGFIVSGAMLVKNGNLPYRDFLSMYGPGQYYITAAIFYLLGENLLYVRFLHALLLSALGIIIYSLAKQSSKNIWGPLLLLLVYVGLVIYVSPTVGYPAITSTIFLLLSAFPLRKVNASIRLKDLIMASCLIGLAGLFRWDFGVFGLIAITIAVLMQQWRNIKSPSVIYLSISAAIIPAILIMAVIYVPLIGVYSDPIRWYAEVPSFSLNEFAKWRNLDFIGPAYQRLFGGDMHKVGGAILKIFYLGFPIFLVIASITTALQAFRNCTVESSKISNLIMIIYLGLICLGLLNQMRVRPNLNQGFPAFATSLPLAILLFNYHKIFISQRKLLRITLACITFIMSVMLLYVGFKSLLGLTSAPFLPFDTPRTSGVRVEPETKSYIELVKYVQDNTTSGEPIFSGVQDHSRLFINDAMLYFLTDRPPADRFLELEPGISNTRRGQEEIINALKQKNVRVIVLADFLSHEPNLTSRSNGVKILDEFIRANYRFDKRFGDRMVFIKN